MLSIQSIRSILTREIKLPHQIKASYQPLSEIFDITTKKLGLREIEVEKDILLKTEDLEKFLVSCIEQGHREEPYESEILSDPSIKDNKIHWERTHLIVWPKYLEKIVVKSDVGEGDLRYSIRGGVLEITPEALLPSSFERFVKDIIKRLKSAGLCINMLRFSTRNQNIILAPLLVLFKDKESVLKNESLKEDLANAYWQTVWATGAIRGGRGTTKPVAFFLIERGSVSEEQSTKIKEIGNRILVGKEAIYLYVLHTLSRKKSLFYDVGKAVFTALYDPSLESEFGISYELLVESMQELNKRGFLDKYIGDNRKLCEVCGSSNILIEDVIPLAGASKLSALVDDFEGARRYCWPKYTDREILGATNSIYFLNFPEEHEGLHSVMNDPAALIMIDGRIVQFPVVKRSSILVGEDGQVAIRVVSMKDVVLYIPGIPEKIKWTKDQATDTGFQINGIPEGEHDFVLFSPAYGRYSPQVSTHLDVTVADNFIRELRCGGGAEIPGNGFVLSVPITLYSDILKAIESQGAMVRADLNVSNLPSDFGKVQHALAIGPQLLKTGEPISDNFFDINDSEEFRVTYQKEGWIVPTRFPHDVDRTRAPRVAVGITAEQEVLLVVVDGRSDQTHSIGVTLKELSTLMKELGCCDAINLDGGGSAVMYVKSDIVRQNPLLANLPSGIANRPSDEGGKERLLPAALAVWHIEHYKNQNAKRKEQS